MYRCSGGEGIKIAEDKQHLNNKAMTQNNDKYGHSDNYRANKR